MNNGKIQRLRIMIIIINFRSFNEFLVCELGKQEFKGFCQVFVKWADGPVDDSKLYTEFGKYMKFKAGEGWCCSYPRCRCGIGPWSGREIAIRHLQVKYVTWLCTFCQKRFSQKQSILAHFRNCRLLKSYRDKGYFQHDPELHGLDVRENHVTLVSSPEKMHPEVIFFEYLQEIFSVIERDTSLLFDEVHEYLCKAKELPIYLAILSLMNENLNKMSEEVIHSIEP